MKGRTLSVLAVAFCLLVVSVPLFAHHGTAAYDLSQTYTVKGKVVKFDFVNPHVQVYFEVTDDKGNVAKWQAELTSPNHLIRAGWANDSLKPGDEVTITGYRTKNGTNSIWIAKLMLRDQEMKLGTD
jgi:hypothetical protein